MSSTLDRPALLGGEVHMLCMYGSIDTIIGRLSRRTVPQSIIIRILNLLIGLSLKGYEGRSVGTIILVGDIEGIRKHTTQMMINPFKGWNDINIMDDTYLSTFESFSQLDGALVLDSKGCAHYAGRMIHVKGEVDCADGPSKGPLSARKGGGTRSRAARFITERTKTVALTLSNNGNITVFENGKELGRLERRTCTFKEGSAPVLVFGPGDNPGCK